MFGWFYIPFFISPWNPTKHICCWLNRFKHHHRSQITMKSPWNHHEITMKSPWNHHEITMKSPWNHHEVPWNPIKSPLNPTESPFFLVKQNSEKSPFRSKLGTSTPPGQWHDTASFSSSARTSKEDFVTSGAGFWDFGDRWWWFLMMMESRDYGDLVGINGDYWGFLMVMESGDLIRVQDEFSWGFDWWFLRFFKGISSRNMVIENGNLFIGFGWVILLVMSWHI